MVSLSRHQTVAIKSIKQTRRQARPGQAGTGPRKTDQRFWQRGEKQSQEKKTANIIIELRTRAMPNQANDVVNGSAWISQTVRGSLGLDLTERYRDKETERERKREREQNPALIAQDKSSKRSYLAKEKTN